MLHGSGPSPLFSWRKCFYFILNIFAEFYFDSKFFVATNCPWQTIWRRIVCDELLVRQNLANITRLIHQNYDTWPFRQKCVSINEKQIEILYAEEQLFLKFHSHKINFILNSKTNNKSNANCKS